jgi:hypothetical protein
MERILYDVYTVEKLVDTSHEPLEYQSYFPMKRVRYFRQMTANC